MNIIHVSFEKPIQLSVNGEIVTITAFKTTERENIKFGIDAPRSIQVNREEVYQMIQKQTSV